MKSKSNNQNIISEIKKLQKSFMVELKKTERLLRVEILKVEERVENIQEQQKADGAKLNKIDNTLDGFVGRVDDLTIENQFGTKQIGELRKRVTKLESPQAA